MSTSKRIAVKPGTYTGRDGQQKNRYKTIGEVVTKDDGGMFVTFDATILNAACFALFNRERNDKIICSLFSDDDKPAASNTPASVADISDDIPF